MECSPRVVDEVDHLLCCRLDGAGARDIARVGLQATSQQVVEKKGGVTMDRDTRKDEGIKITRRRNRRRGKREGEIPDAPALSRRTNLTSGLVSIIAA